MKKVVILGSTGSIGRAAVEIISQASDDFVITGLAAESNINQMQEQLADFPDAFFSLYSEAALNRLIKKDPLLGKRERGSGSDGVLALVEEGAADIVINAMVGISGLLPTIKALEMGSSVALANKEALVTGGHIINDLIQNTAGRIIPVDSEHFSLSRCLRGNREDTLEIILTASGGPFYKRDMTGLSDVTVEEVLDHPTWKMGKKVTVDSAHLINKGLEVIEAHWLFDFPYDSIGVVIHPQSIVHSLTRMKDGSLLAHLGPADMRLPIINALYYPVVAQYPWEPLSVNDFGRLDFVQFERKDYPGFDIVMQAAKAGGTAPTVLNAADEVAVSSFLSGKTGFMTIIDWIREALDAHIPSEASSLEDIIEADRWTRRFLSERHKDAVIT
ncbi:MAG: 1-deoxy-D-xylulose-5-phosphate reductoisomerase [Candidatus Krumholzibacteriota bacterium]|nr:1-deoxy-D-xylulose-5-phosphate reductoisomerase [Candidatus Krumholzibacteriota bacterium]